jgi:prepilin-type N-terminal cleavage/methylation domain-containing protein
MNKAFTMIEVMVALFLLVVGGGSAFALVQGTMALSETSEDQLEASYMAQEGIEIIRNIRDANWVRQRIDPGVLWDDGIAIDEDYRLDYLSDSFPDTSCPFLNEGTFLKYDGNFYNCSDGQDSKFKRKVTVEKPGAGIIDIEVEVSWSERGRSHKVTAQTLLYNWK